MGKEYRQIVDSMKCPDIFQVKRITPKIFYFFGGFLN